MLDKNVKDVCNISVEVFEEIFLTLKQKHSCDYAYSVATELTKIVFIAVADV